MRHRSVTQGQQPESAVTSGSSGRQKNVRNLRVSEIQESNDRTSVGGTAPLIIHDRRYATPSKSGLILRLMKGRTRMARLSTCGPITEPVRLRRADNRSRPVSTFEQSQPVPVVQMWESKSSTSFAQSVRYNHTDFKRPNTAKYRLLVGTLPISIYPLTTDHNRSTGRLLPFEVARLLSFRLRLQISLNRNRHHCRLPRP